MFAGPLELKPLGVVCTTFVSNLDGTLTPKAKSSLTSERLSSERMLKSEGTVAFKYGGDKTCNGSWGVVSGVGFSWYRLLGALDEL